MAYVTFDRSRALNFWDLPSCTRRGGQARGKSHQARNGGWEIQFYLIANSPIVEPELGSQSYFHGVPQIIGRKGAYTALWWSSGRGISGEAPFQKRTLCHRTKTIGISRRCVAKICSEWFASPKWALGLAANARFYYLVRFGGDWVHCWKSALSL